MLLKDNYVFLTRNELQILGFNCIYIHLKHGDKRIKQISKLIGNEKLRILTVNPKVSDLIGADKIIPNKWYIIETLKYEGSSDYSGYTHFSFGYKFKQNYMWEERGIKPLDSPEDFTNIIEEY